ncbi:MAG: YtxH domain-containing protein [Anaerolineae bacterium]
MVWGMIIGAVVGFGLALYRAPQSGEETRHQLTEMSADLKRRAQETARDAREQAQAAARPAVKRAEQMASRAEDLVGDVSARGRAVLEEQMRSRSNGHG